MVQTNVQEEETHTPDCLNSKTIGNDSAVSKSKEICVGDVLSGYQSQSLSRSYGSSKAGPNQWL
jgi:hypothetical protein